MRTVAVCLLLVASCEASGNGGGGPVVVQPDGGNNEPPFVFETPGLQSIAPNRLSLGDVVQVFGSGFLPAEHGKMFLEVDGTYTDDLGDTHAYRGSFDLTFKNPSLAEFELESLVFSPTGDRLGTFEGTARVLSRLETGNDAGLERRSGDLGATLVVGPSIELTELRSVNHPDCQPVTTRTISGAPLSLGVSAIGLGEATEGRPMTFRVTFQAPALAVRYLRTDVWGTFPPRDGVYIDAPEGLSTMTFRVTEGNSLLLDPTWKQSSGQVSPPVRVGQDEYTEVTLGGLQGGIITGGPGPSIAAIIVEARLGADATNDEFGGAVMARRVIHLELWNEWEIMRYNGNQRLAERFAPEIPSGQCGSCIPGGDNGPPREISYSEGQSESRSRSVGIRWDVNVANSVGINVMVGPWVPWQIAANAQTTWAETFGMDENESISTETHRTFNISAQLFPQYYALCYRQLSRYEREVDIRYHGACGESVIVGQAILTDWGWGFDVATGRQCEPETNLPPAQVFE